jgi:hypothetical protein
MKIDRHIYRAKVITAREIGDKRQPPKWVVGVWFWIDNLGLGLYLSEEDYFYNKEYIQTDLAGLTSASDEQLTMIMAELLDCKQYHAYIAECEKYEKSEIWADEAPLPEGADQAMTSEDWLAEISINECKVAA